MTAYASAGTPVVGSMPLVDTPSPMMPQMPTGLPSFGQECYQGIPSHQLPAIEIVSPQIRKDIQQGKDVNLALLLLPLGSKSDETTQRHVVLGDEVVALKPMVDTRLSRPLTIQEFVTAFSIYRQVMCEAFPQRRAALDKYLRDVIGMAGSFPGLGFYEYHKQFAACAATWLLNYNTLVDWGVRDNNLYVSIFSGQKAVTCALCQSASHATHFCHLSATSSKAKNGDIAGGTLPNGGADILGRPKVTIGGQEVCNDFNVERGCARGPKCKYMHRCKRCHRMGHGMSDNKCPPEGKKVLDKKKTA
jgi:hypothetical protein